MKFLWALSLIAVPVLSSGQTLNYSEAIDGDLSDDYLQPTLLPVAPGDNFLTGTLTGGTNDLDLFRIVVPAGVEVTAIRLVEASGGINGSFLLLQPGDTLSAPPSNNFSEPIGFSILSASETGEDLLETITIPLIPSLAPFFGQATLTEGTYAGWLNETGAASTYTLNFETRAVAVPEPNLIFLPALSLFLGRRSRTRS